MKETGINLATIREIRKAAESFGLDSVILFGSRARGDHRPKSDIDLAISGGDIDSFSAYVDESAPTLLQFDYVPLDKTTNEELISLVNKEGISLYEKA